VLAATVRTQVGGPFLLTDNVFLLSALDAAVANNVFVPRRVRIELFLGFEVVERA
jgi:hypothetical protein